jgi:hypothetical protein
MFDFCRFSCILARKISGLSCVYPSLSRCRHFKKALLSAGAPEWSAEAMLDLQRFYREGKASQTTDDVERLLGRKPITFGQFARDYAFAFREEEKVAS